MPTATPYDRMKDILNKKKQELNQHPNPTNETTPVPTGPTPAISSGSKAVGHVAQTPTPTPTPSPPAPNWWQASSQSAHGPASAPPPVVLPDNADPAGVGNTNLGLEPWERQMHVIMNQHAGMLPDLIDQTYADEARAGRMSAAINAKSGRSVLGGGFAGGQAQVSLGGMENRSKVGLQHQLEAMNLKMAHLEKVYNQAEKEKDRQLQLDVQRMMDASMIEAARIEGLLNANYDVFLAMSNPQTSNRVLGTNGNNGSGGGGGGSDSGGGGGSNDSGGSGGNEEIEDIRPWRTHQGGYNKDNDGYDQDMPWSEATSILRDAIGFSEEYGTNPVDELVNIINPYNPERATDEAYMWLEFEKERRALLSDYGVEFDKPLSGGGGSSSNPGANPPSGVPGY